MKIGNELESSSRLLFLPGINLAKLVSVKYEEYDSTKYAGTKGPRIVLEFKAKDKEQNERFMSVNITPPITHYPIDPKNKKHVDAFNIFGRRVKHIFECYAPWVEVEGKDYFTICKLIADNFNGGTAEDAVPIFQDKLIWIIACYENNYLGCPTFTSPNFAEAYVQGKHTTLQIDPVRHKMEKEVVQTTANASANALDGPSSPADSLPDLNIP